MATPIILGSQSPRRLELLQSVVAAESIRVISPQDEKEAGFDDCREDSQIEMRLREIVSAKLGDVRGQIRASSKHNQHSCLICADTVVVVEEANETSVVLGKPPVQDWQKTVREWFVKYYRGRPHQVWTCFAVTDSECCEFEIVKTSVTFEKIDDWWIDWYLATDEPVGKAGGYGIQGHAAALVKSLSGSLTNVIGLPVLELTNALRRLRYVS